MVDGIKISLLEVVDRARSIRTIKQAMRTALSQAGGQIGALQSGGAWDSPAGRAFVSKFSALEARFNENELVIEAFADHLEATATNYQLTDGVVNKNADLIA